MIHQLNFYGKDKVQVALERIKTFEPKEGYHLAFSGGKDSCVVKKLMEMSGVNFESVYHVTSLDPPELVQFIKKHHPDTVFDFPRYSDGKVITMWNLIPKIGTPPTRIARYCCRFIKESYGDGKFVVTGVRKAESVRRQGRGGVEFSDKKTGNRDIYDVDNVDEQMLHTCQLKRIRVLNPIIDWDDDDVWEFIREYNVPYCSLYDEGKKRLGCIGCPMQPAKDRIQDFERYPKYKDAYIRAFNKMIEQNKERHHKKQKEYSIEFENAEDVFEWWIK